MSCDFGVWWVGEPMDGAAAGKLYDALCAGDTTGLQASASVFAFYRELISIHPQPDDVPAEQVDDPDVCPWSCAFDRSPRHLIVSCVWSKAEYVRELIHRLARRHGLGVFDPQNEVFTQSMSTGAQRDRLKPPSPGDERSSTVSLRYFGFDFTAVRRATPGALIEGAVERLRERLANNDDDEEEERPTIVIPDGATEEELLALERSLGRALPAEYRRFLSLHRYLVFNEGLHIGGIVRGDSLSNGSPWITTMHRPGHTDLVIGSYDLLVDGDHLILDLDNPSHPVRVYLHEEEERWVPYAPSLSLAVWRLAVEFAE